MSDTCTSVCCTSCAVAHVKTLRCFTDTTCQSIYAQITTTGTVRPQYLLVILAVFACAPAPRTTLRFSPSFASPGPVLHRFTDQIGNEQLAAALDYAGYDSQLIIGTGWHNKVHGAHVFPDTLRWMFGAGEAPSEFATFLSGSKL